MEFQPGRTDSAAFDAADRLPAPTEPLSHAISYFWVNGLTNFGAFGWSASALLRTLMGGVTAGQSCSFLVASLPAMLQPSAVLARLTRVISCSYA